MIQCNSANAESEQTVNGLLAFQVGGNDVMLNHSSYDNLLTGLKIIYISFVGKKICKGSYLNWFTIYNTKNVRLFSKKVNCATVSFLIKMSRDIESQTQLSCDFSIYRQEICCNVLLKFHRAFGKEPLPTG